MEKTACTPIPVEQGLFNAEGHIPYGCTVEHIGQAMRDFAEFLGYMNSQLYTRDLRRLEIMLMPANFSSLVDEFMHSALAKYCPSLVKNQYHNGHPDLLPNGFYPGNAVLHGSEGIEIKASRHTSGWQGHNAEGVWLMVFVFDANSQRDRTKLVAPRPFRFVTVAGAQLLKSDWSESGRSATSRRTPTASVLKTGYNKIMANWLYQAQR